jgi:hypothetical protein
MERVEERIGENVGELAKLLFNGSQRQSTVT